MVSQPLDEVINDGLNPGGRLSHFFMNNLDRYRCGLEILEDDFQFA